MHEQVEITENFDLKEKISDASKPKRPKIPAEMYEPSTVGTVVFILYACAMYAFPAYTAYLVVQLALPLPIRILIMIPLIIISGNGLLLMAFLGHDGTHFSLHRNKVLSTIIGCFFSSSIMGFLEIGFAINHWDHHRYTNQKSDPDHAHYSQFNSLWSRLIFARLLYNFKIFQYTLKSALGLPLPFAPQLPFKPKTLSILSWLNLGFSVAWLSLYVAIAVYNPLLALVAIALPSLVVLTLSGFLSFVQHSGTGKGFFHDTRTLTSPLWTALQFGGNYHLEHHIYPGVPIYRLPTIHRILKAQGFYEHHQEMHIEPAFLGSFAHLQSQYPESSEDSDFNPLLRAVEVSL